ncbi:MAG: transaldolase family protein [Ilumatobacteraceae bacterium]
MARGARVQRPLWASTSTKNPAYPDTLYVDQLIGPDTVNTLPDTTLEAFADHGTLARTIDDGVDEARALWAALPGLGVDMDDVAEQLEREGVSSFQKSFDELITAPRTRLGREIAGRARRIRHPSRPHTGTEDSAVRHVRSSGSRPRAERFRSRGGWLRRRSEVHDARSTWM